jgi:hypothetical protein
MSKQDEKGATKAAPAKRRLISQAPPPIEPLPRGAYVAPANIESDRSSAGTLREAEFGFQEAQRHCNEAIRKGRDVKRVDQKGWAYEAKRWSKVLRPELEHAFTKCRDVGMSADKLAELDWRIKKLDCEWSLVCEHRESMPVPVATAGELRANNKAQAKAATAGAKARGILEAINQIWGGPDKIPRGLSAKERNNKIRDKIGHNSGSRSKNDEAQAKAIQRVLKAARSK